MEYDKKFRKRTKLYGENKEDYLVPHQPQDPYLQTIYISLEPIISTFTIYV